MNGVVHPLYVSAPAPMGIGDFGIKNVSGNLTPYQLSTSSFEGSISINNLTALYALNDAPSNVSIQLNTVLNNITLFGNSNYSFWTQNVLLYSSNHHTIRFEDNLWNFSGPESPLTTNAIYKSNGDVLPYPGVHIAYGPSFAVKAPFTVHLFINSTLIDNRNAVYFNYSIPQLSHHGTYDCVIFNSTYSPNQTFKTPMGNFLVSGTHVTPTGYLLYDAEMMIGGPGGGSTTTLYDVNANMTLKYFNATTKGYMNVPSAYNYGTDTGETSSGESIYWTSRDVASINTGPSILEGMWGIQPSSNAGAMKISGSIEPSNAFMFVNMGTKINNVTAQWSPDAQNGNFMLFLTPGTYSIQVLLSNYAPMYEENITGPAVNLGPLKLVYNESYFGYTPLYALNNGQLASISVYGNGSASSPYILDEQSYVDPVFGHVNDFGFPVFMAVFLSRTTMYASSLGNTQPTTELSFNTQAIFNDSMPYAFYRAQNYSMVGMQISGTLFPGEAGFIAGEVTFWDSSNDVVIGSSFSTYYPIATVNSTDITLSNSANTYSGSHSLVYLFCGSLNLAGDLFTGSIIIDVNGTANIVNSKIIQDTLCFVDGATVDLRGNVIDQSFLLTNDSKLTSTDNNAIDDEYIISMSSLNSYNDIFACNLLYLDNSTFSGVNGNSLLLTIISINSSASFTGTYISNTFFYSLESLLDLNSVALNDTMILTMGGITDITGSSSYQLFILTIKGTSMIDSSQICVLEGVTELGNFSLSGSVVSAMEYESLYSNNTFSQSSIQSVPSTSGIGSGFPTFILSLYGNNILSGLTFTIDNYQTSLSTPSGFNNLNLNSVTFLDGVNSVTDSTFYTAGGNSGANLILEYGTNNVQHNTFISKNVSLILNPYGAGSSLIVYGGVNVIGNNKFVTINSQAQSSLLKYGDAATQSSNQYLYSVNFTETGLPAGKNWTVVINGTSYYSNLSYINVLLSPGTYSYTATSNAYGSESGSVTVVSSSVNEQLTFSKLPKYSVTFTEQGLPSGMNWRK